MMKKNILLATAVFIEIVGIFLLIVKGSQRTGFVFLGVGLVFLVIALSQKKTVGFFHGG
jgi:hypothetical protein